MTPARKSPSTSATLFLVKKPEPPAEMVEETLDDLVNSDLGEFANNLQTARVLWRQFRELVEAPEMASHLRAAFVERNGNDPSDDRVSYFEEALDPGYRESLRSAAIEVVRGRMQDERCTSGQLDVM